MKKSLIKGFILGTIFVFSIILFSNMMNKEMAKNTADMEKQTMPVMYMQVADVLVNPMYAHTDEMQVNYVRDQLTPVTTTRDLTAVINPDGHTVKTINYEVLSVDDGSVIENGKLNNIKQSGDYQKADFHLETPILMNQEYMLKFTVDYGEDKPVYYYTRLVQRAGLNTSQYLEFVQVFYEKCMSKEAAKDLTTYLEPDENTTTTNFTKININSSFEQLTWGNLKPAIFRKAVPVIKEINETTCSIALQYEISAEDSDNNMEYYTVSEFYRMRYTESRVRLLDFERSTQQIFDGNLPVLTSQGINLGVVDKDIQYTSNQNADIIAFVQAGDLWSYNRSANKAAKIFSFREQGVADERLDNPSHEIEIIRVEESGDIDFVLYGYMSRGMHEGQMGVGVYHYSAERNIVEEQIFIPTAQGFDFLKEDVQHLAYVNKEDTLYLYLENNLYAINLSEKSYDTLLENMNPDCFVVSKSQANVAWMDEMKENGSSTITFMSLERGEARVLQAESGQKIKALGFINEDLIYGLARDQDIVTDASGSTVFGMSLVRIENFNGQVIKEYQENGVWVSGVVLKEGLVELQRVQWQEDAYVPFASENIMNNLQTSEETVSIHLSVSDRKGTQVALDFSKSAKSKSMLVVTAKYEVLEDSGEMSLNTPPSDNQVYYVYAQGKLDSIHTKVNEAILCAEENLGVVLNSQQQYIWERGNQQDREQLSGENIPPAVLAGILDETTLQQELGDEYTVLNLFGCSLESVLYQVGMQRAVIARKPTGESVVIVGYDSYNTILYDPVTQETYYYGKDDSTALFTEAGNVFLGYIEKAETDKQ